MQLSWLRSPRRTIESLCSSSAEADEAAWCELALSLKLEGKDLRSKGLSDIGALRQRHHPPISNRDTNLLETSVTQTKQKTAPRSNRDKTRLFHNAIRTPDVSHRQLPDTDAHRILIGNQIIRTRGNPKKTKDATRL